jgi:hypothetical protein
MDVENIGGIGPAARSSRLGRRGVPNRVRIADELDRLASQSMRRKGDGSSDDVA